MNKVLLFLLFASSGITVSGQVLINLQLPPSGIVIKSQLWNFSLVNTSTTVYDIQVEVTLTDMSNNQLVLTGTSKLFQLARGARQIQPGDVAPVTYNVTGSGYGIDASPDGFLPVGRFMICFDVLRVSSDLSERLAEECETVEVEPISPPILIAPSDSDQLEISHPLFTWIPPSPFTLFNNLRYDWVLVEVAPLQTGATALQQNVPLLSQSNLTSTNFQYPLSAADLDTGKIYAWQVAAKNNMNTVAQSEVWTFRVRKPGLDTTTTLSKDGFYARLKRQENASFVASYGKVNYEYFNEASSGTVNINVLDISGSVRRAVSLDSSNYAVKPGQNLMQLDLTEKGLVNGHTYLLELISRAGDHWYLKFEFRQPN
jgi:hypothetical protein